MPYQCKYKLKHSSSKVYRSSCEKREPSSLQKLIALLMVINIFSIYQGHYLQKKIVEAEETVKNEKPGQ